MSYIKNMRKYIGSETLFTVGCGVIIEEKDMILLQHRADGDNWCIPGGIMEIGETFEDAAKREVLEETGLTVSNLELFGLYSGEKCFAAYPNGDQVFSTQVIFYTKTYTGTLKAEDLESREHRFFKRDEIPPNLNPRQKYFILDWKKGAKTPVIS
ncbi:MAG TPA: NUDIX hydrolase [Bacillus sp. (in: firmicutes)]|uniref:NUDIX hydrolase n=1 Tax=Bacillus litorisediminis TaxID=2922713 RepID=UPI001FADED54|nr:NUDIX hydrolase [Bacillus litorisediminis]HWO75332.1 NUDIX hydrolase [Bacillus sp. (in: firmicutes)]